MKCKSGKTRWMKALCNVLLAIVLAFAPAVPNAHAAGEVVWIRACDISGLSNGYLTVSLMPFSGNISSSGLEFYVGQVKTDATAIATDPSLFRYVLVVDISQPYYTSRKEGHGLVVQTAVNRIISSMNPSSQVAFVWAGQNNVQTLFMDPSAATQAMNSQLDIIDANNNNDITDVDMNAALGTALQMCVSDNLLYSIIVVSDGGSAINDMSGQLQQSGVPLHAFAMRHSDFDTSNGRENTRAAAAGRSTLMQMCNAVGGAYNEWDISGRTRGREYEGVNTAMIDSAIQNWEKNTSTYLLTFPEESLAAAHESTDQSVVVYYNGNPLVAFMTPDMHLSSLPTPLPQETEPTPVPVKVIHFGMQSEPDPEIIELQQLLMELGYLSGDDAVTGIYDGKTRDAYRELWEANNSQPKESYDDFSVDELNTLRLYQSKATPVPEVVDIQAGESGEYVQKLQSALNNLGYFHRLTVNGGNVFDSDTQEAVNRFCIQNGFAVPEAGGCSASLFQAILASKNEYMKPEVIDLLVNEKDNGEDKYVQALQEILAEKGYLLSGYTLGVLDQQTLDAIAAICAENGWEAPGDGMVSVDIQRKIRTAGSKATPSPVPSATPKPEVMSLSMGDTGEYVTRLQGQLSALGYFWRLTRNNGVFDADTQEAVYRFCDQTDSVRPASGCDEELFRTILASETAFQKPLYIVISLNDSDRSEDTYIADLQQRLAELNYLTDIYKKGTYDEITCDAMTIFLQESGYVNADIRAEQVSEEWQQLLFSANAQPKVMATATPKPEYINLQYGSRDTEDTDYVIRLQNRLKDLGYYDEEIPAEGVYDDATAAAVLRFQEQNALDTADAGRSISVNQLQNDLFGKELTRVKTVSERFIAFVLQDVEIMNFQIPMWAILTVCVVLVFAIIIIIILAVHRNKGSDYVQDSPSHEPAARRPHSPSDDKETVSSENSEATESDLGEGVQPVYTDASAYAASMAATSATTANGYTSMTSGSSGEDAPTVNDDGSGPAGGAFSITFEVRFNGTSQIRTLPLNGRIRIGRNSRDCELALDASDRTASRVHCELYMSGSQLMVHNLSNSQTGTILNGTRIASDSVPLGEDSPTEDMNASVSISDGTAAVHSGDTLTVGRHTIVITY